VRPTVVPTAAPTATLSIFPTMTTNLKGILFLFGVANYQPEPIIQNVNLQDKFPGQDCYIVFGQKSKFKKSLNLNDLPSTSGMVGNTRPAMSRENVVRSVTVVGDLNQDGNRDLVIGYPFSSVCFVYLGKGNEDQSGFNNLIVSFAIYGADESEFGWAISGIGDLNSDQVDDLVVSAKALGVIYVLFGKTESSFKDLYVEQLTSSQGFKISGSANTFNFGVSLSGAGDFNRDGARDIVFSAMRSSSQAIVYVLLGNNSNPVQDIDLDQLSQSINMFTILTPPFSFAGLSLTGIGDINSDGYDDVAIGSLPYKGGYQVQRTYLIYGRELSYRESLDLTEMREGIDGTNIVGGGMIVAAPGDVNGDGIADLLIVNYPSWQGKASSYLIEFPHNITSPPTLIPSPFPSSLPSSEPSLSPTLTLTTHTPSNLPTIIATPLPTNNLSTTTFPSISSGPTTIQPTRPPKATTAPKSVRPTLPPTVNPSHSPPSEIPSFSPSSTVAPSNTLNPSTKAPVFVKASARPTIPRKLPTSSSSFRPTIFNGTFSTDFQIVYCNETTVHCQGSTTVNTQFIIRGPGTIRVSCGSGSSRSGSMLKCTYLMFPTPIGVFNAIILQDFDLQKDSLDFSQFPNLQSKDDISFSTNPDALILSVDQFILFPSKVDILELTGSNFFFEIPADATADQNSLKSPSDSVSQTTIIVMLVMVFGFVFLILYRLYSQFLNDKDKKMNKATNCGRPTPPLKWQQHLSEPRSLSPGVGSLEADAEGDDEEEDENDRDEDDDDDFEISTVTEEEGEIEAEKGDDDGTETAENEELVNRSKSGSEDCLIPTSELSDKYGEEDRREEVEDEDKEKDDLMDGDDDITTENNYNKNDSKINSRYNNHDNDDNESSQLDDEISSWGDLSD
jgi:hypothetical protein